MTFQQVIPMLYIHTYRYPMKNIVCNFLHSGSCAECIEGFQQVHFLVNFPSCTILIVHFHVNFHTTLPTDILLSSDPNVLCQWLFRYAAETRMTTGKSYPPSTVYRLLTGLMQHMRDVNPNAVNFLIKQDAQFSMLHKSLDCLFEIFVPRMLVPLCSMHSHSQR